MQLKSIGEFGAIAFLSGLSYYNRFAFASESSEILQFYFTII